MKRLLTFLILPLFLFGCQCQINLRKPRTDVQETRVDFPPPTEYPPPVVWVWAKNVSEESLSVVYYRGDFESKKGRTRRWTRIIRCDFGYNLPPGESDMTRCTFVDGRPSPVYEESDTLKVTELAFNE